MQTFLLAALIASTSAFTIAFQNNCDYSKLITWAAIGQASNGVPDPSVSYGVELESGATLQAPTGNRAWGRTGYDSNGTNCATGGYYVHSLFVLICGSNNDPGLVCTDAGINSGVVLSEYGYDDFGQWGGEPTSWDISRVDSSINIDTRLSCGDGQSVICTGASCPDDQAYSYGTDYAADRNSALWAAFTHPVC
ncbi:Osmotin thaumatin-like protein [Hymenopellis radicata]|nr:Osmotin thaumatin-like protein [Hymenopellis radicata]